ncbi:hypothetical protein GGR50DRAFT_691851 [Xylaria sp. CBS 124048]|nr:hypothetical protein GGR50DRAFT_691851 [Xylaria sp. CBS 124048]
MPSDFPDKPPDNNDPGCRSHNGTHDGGKVVVVSSQPIRDGFNIQEFKRCLIARAFMTPQEFVEGIKLCGGFHRAELRRSTQQLLVDYEIERQDIFSDIPDHICQTLGPNWDDIIVYRNPDTGVPGNEYYRRLRHYLKRALDLRRDTTDNGFIPPEVIAGSILHYGRWFADLPCDTQRDLFDWKLHFPMYAEGIWPALNMYLGEHWQVGMPRFPKPRNLAPMYDHCLHLVHVLKQGQADTLQPAALILAVHTYRCMRQPVPSETLALMSKWRMPYPELWDWICDLARPYIGRSWMTPILRVLTST